MEFSMRVLFAAFGMLLSVTAAKADLAVVSGKALILRQSYQINPDCSPTGEVIMRVSQAPEHGSVSIRQAGVFTNFTASNPRYACNRRRVRGVIGTYVSRPGYIGSDYVELEVFYPDGGAVRARLPIDVR
jgi:hypothetical protein